MMHTARSQADGHSDSEDVLIEIAAVAAADSLAKIRPGLHLVDDLQFTLVDRLLLAANLEHRFAVRIGPSIARGWRQVADVVACIEQLRAPHLRGEFCDQQRAQSELDRQV